MKPLLFIDIPPAPDLMDGPVQRDFVQRGVGKGNYYYVCVSNGARVPMYCYISGTSHVTGEAMTSLTDYSSCSLIPHDQYIGDGVLGGYFKSLARLCTTTLVSFKMYFTYRM